MVLFEVLEITVSSSRVRPERGCFSAQKKKCRARRHGKFQGEKPGQARRVSEPPPMPMFRHGGISNPLTAYINDTLTI